MSVSQDAASPTKGNSPLGRLSRRRRWILAAIAILCAAGAVDALFIEPYWIQITHYDVTAPVRAPLKIAAISDIHTHGIGRREREMFRILNREHPDLIVVLGDTLGDDDATYGECHAVYEKLHAPLGVWVVRGNWENMAPLHHERAFYQSAGVHLLLNSNTQIEPGLWLAGFDDPSSGTPKIDSAFAGIPAGAYTIALFHSPAFFDRIAGRANLCLAAHTHGGQVLLPPIKPFWLPKGCGRFLSGWYQEDGSRMYVTRGVGMSILPIRFLCRPEVTFFTLRPADSVAH